VGGRGRGGKETGEKGANCLQFILPKMQITQHFPRVQMLPLLNEMALEWNTEEIYFYFTLAGVREHRYLQGMTYKRKSNSKQGEAHTFSRAPTYAHTTHVTLEENGSTNKTPLDQNTQQDLILTSIIF
jgi:hypothetical protein